MGEAGVTRCLELIQRELELSMAFCGRTDVRDVDGGILLPPPGAGRILATPEVPA
jgi:L-lactate dehydrogenase (cytochrome)